MVKASREGISSGEMKLGSSRVVLRGTFGDVADEVLGGGGFSNCHHVSDYRVLLNEVLPDGLLDEFVFVEGSVVFLGEEEDDFVPDLIDDVVVDDLDLDLFTDSSVFGNQFLSTTICTIISMKGDLDFTDTSGR